MRIAILSELFPPYLQGGGERRYYEIARRLARKHEWHVFTMHIKGSRREEVLEGMHVHRLGKTHPLKKRAYGPLVPYFFEAMKRVSKERFDIIDCNAYVSAFAGFFAGRSSKTPCIVTIHDIYGKDWGHFLGNPALGLIGRGIESLLLRLPFDRFVTVSSASKKLLEGYGTKKTCVIPNGVDNVFQKKSGVKRKQKILFVGRLVPLKNIHDLLNAFSMVLKEHPDVGLELIGEGPLREELGSLAECLGIKKRVRFSGSVRSHSDVAKKMRESKVLVNPSLREGFGLVLLEAMSCGTPPIGYKLGAYNDFADSRNSILVAQGDHAGLAEGIKELLENKRYWSILSKNGKKTAKGFSWSNTVKKTELLYKELVK